MSHFAVLGDTAVSHLPSPITSSIDHDQHPRPTSLNNEISNSYPSPQSSSAFTGMTNPIKQEGQIKNKPITLDHQPQHASSHPQPPTPTSISSYQFSLASAHPQFSPPSQTQPHYIHQSSTVSSLQPFSENQLGSTTSHLSYHQGTLPPLPNRFSLPNSPSLPLPHFSSSQHSYPSHQLDLSYCPTSSLYSSSNFNSEQFFNQSDHPHSPPNWPDSLHAPHFDRHRSISFSAPISTARPLSTPDSGKDYQFHRLLNLPVYHSLELSDQVACSSGENGHSNLSSLGLPNFDCHYNYNVQRNPSPFTQPNLRKVLQSITNTDHPGQPDYLSGSSPSALNHRLDVPARSSHSPPDSFPGSLPRYLSASASQPPTSQKRKFDSESHDSPRPRRPSPVSTHSTEMTAPARRLESGHPRMTTVLCFHASVAQKSYGQEKRFLCPPPLVRITGPYRQLPKSHRPVLSMSILNEDGSTHLSQTALLGEDNTNVHFKSLHISGAAKKAKHVNLELSLHPPPLYHPQPHHHLVPEMEDILPPFATFRSSDCNVISKPSKKTAKARNTQSCIFNGSTICLFNRINSQTVRTKYLCVQDGQLAARAAQWSAFVIRVVRRAEEAGADGTPPLAAKTLLSSNIPGADRTVTYGSEVELVDFVTGVSSGPLVVRKVEKNTVLKDATGPVSQMQKLAFCQVDKINGSAQYISALEGSNLATDPLAILEFDPTSGVHHHASNLSAESLSIHQFDSSEVDRRRPLEDKPGLSGYSLESDFAPARPLSVFPPARLHNLQLQAPRAILPPEELEGTSLDEIDDSVAWTVIGVAHFSHSFIDLSHQYPQIPQTPITPFPTLTCRPIVDLHALTMSLRVTGFFDAHNQPMEVWLGPIGALATTILGTSGLSSDSHKGDTEHKDSTVPHGFGLHMPLHINRTRDRRESTLSISLPSLESIHWTLHQKSMPPRSMVVLDESNRSMSELVGRETEGKPNQSAHIPALPITLIRADGISFVMGHSICLSEVSQEDQKENACDPVERSCTLVLKVI